METLALPLAHSIMAPPPPLPPSPPIQPPPPSPPSPTPSLPSPPTSLPEELIEEILLRFPPGEPASLFRAAVVCKPWCRLISGPRFRRRFREHHRTPPMLGFLGNNSYAGARLVPTNAFCPPGSYHFDWDALDARHGRVLVQRYVPENRGYALIVWDPITDEQRVLPTIPPRLTLGFIAAVLCAGGHGAGVCRHLDCHRGPFLVVLAGQTTSEMFVCTYSSDVDAWSEPISAPHLDICKDFKERPVLVGNAIYFGIESTNIALKYNLESHELSWIQLPDECNYCRQRHELTTTEEGLLGLVTIFDSELSMWLRKGPPEVDAGWTKIRIIDLKTVLPLDSFFTSPHVVGFADGPGILFVKVKNDLYTIDLKTYQVEFYQSNRDICIVPYMSFYTPELEVACTGDEPSAGGSNACQS